MRQQASVRRVEVCAGRRLGAVAQVEEAAVGVAFEVVRVGLGDSDRVAERGHGMVVVAAPVQRQAEYRAADRAPRRCGPAAFQVERVASRLHGGVDAAVHVAVDGAEAGDARRERR